MTGDVDTVLAAYTDPAFGQEDKASTDTVTIPSGNIPALPESKDWNLEGTWSVATDAADQVPTLEGFSIVTTGSYDFQPDGAVTIQLHQRDDRAAYSTEEFTGTYELRDEAVVVVFSEYREKFLRRKSGTLVRVETNRPTWETCLELINS